MRGTTGTARTIGTSTVFVLGVPVVPGVLVVPGVPVVPGVLVVPVRYFAKPLIRLHNYLPSSIVPLERILDG